MIWKQLQVTVAGLLTFSSVTMYSWASNNPNSFHLSHASFFLETSQEGGRSSRRPCRNKEAPLSCKVTKFFLLDPKWSSLLLIHPKVLQCLECRMCPHTCTYTGMLLRDSTIMDRSGSPQLGYHDYLNSSPHNYHTHTHTHIHTYYIHVTHIQEHNSTTTLLAGRG